MHRLVKPALVLLFLTATLTISGCGGNMMGTTTANMASLRLVQGNSSAGTVSLMVNGMAVSSNLMFPNSTAYMSINVGSQLSLQASNLSPNAALSPMFNVPANSRNTLVLDGWGPFGFSTMMLSDDMSVSANGNPKLRVMNGATMSGPFDVFVIPTGMAPSGAPTISAQSFNMASAYSTLPAGSYDVFFTAMGDPTHILFHSASIMLGMNQNRTLVLMNDCSATACSPNVLRSSVLADMN